MSLRTMPARCSTSGPFDPSPGYGPAVSSGISPAAESADDPPDAPSPESREHAASNAVVVPTPNSARTLRLVTSVWMSKDAP
ncbi:hypothetical protein [Gordonia zhaorongruii]|uniref:hypothetical protein n=1 Tax=Gordonia zhaorongruii TaxID=2597659 RepID=UPI0031456E5B